MSDIVATAEEPVPEPEPEGEQNEAKEAAINAAADDAQARLWLRALTPLLELRSHDSDPSARVQFAYDRMFVAACERAARILGSDLPPAPP